MNISGGEFKGRKIIAPDEKITRPTLSKVRMGVFNSLFSLLGDFEGLSFLDTYGGSGIMGLEALSRGFKSVTVIEINKKSASIIKKNYETIGVKSNLIIGNSLKVIPGLNKVFDVGYVDPPYQGGVYEETIKLLTPICKYIVLEHPKDMILSEFGVVNQKRYGDKIITYLKTQL